jgi:hypothetical protein
MWIAPYSGLGSPVTICERIRRGSIIWCCGQIDRGFWYTPFANAVR